MGYQTIAWACKKCRVANQHNIKINKSEAVQASFDCRHCGAIGPDVTLLFAYKKEELQNCSVLSARRKAFPLLDLP